MNFWQFIKQNITLILLVLIIFNETITNIELWQLNKSLHSSRITIETSIQNISNELYKDTDKLVKAFAGSIMWP